MYSAITKVNQTTGDWADTKDGVTVWFWLCQTNGDIGRWFDRVSAGEDQER